MTMLSPAAIYRRQQNTPDFDVDNSHELIKATMEYLIRSLAILEREPERGSEMYKTHISRALTAIYVLQSSLDFDRGGAVANNLFQLYEYSRQQILKLMRRDASADIALAHTAIREIHDAWQQIG